MRRFLAHLVVISVLAPMCLLQAADNGPQGNGSQGNGPQANWPQGNGPQANWPQDNGPQANGPQANGPQANWPQGNGPNGNYVVQDQAAATKWSVARGENVRWVKTLPETGQSTVTIWGDRIFFTTLKPVQADAELGQDVVAWCCKASDGEVIWQRKIAAKYPLRLSGCFSDSSSPPPVTDGNHVCFFNASGTIACFDLDGKQLWSKESMAVGRAQPFLLDGAIVYILQSYMPENGHFGHNHKHAPLDQWTQLEAIEITSGKRRWLSKCGVGMGSVPVAHQLDGKPVILVGRGGGHSPPEKPDGISMIDASNGSTKWTLPLDDFMSTMTMNARANRALVFHKGEHLWVDMHKGTIEKRVSFVTDVPTCLRKGDGFAVEPVTLPGKKPRSIIQQSNVMVGDYHYFRSYTQPFLGRVHIETGRVEMLQLPLQFVPGKSAKEDSMLWSKDEIADRSDALKKGNNLSYHANFLNEVKNSRGFVVMGDKRSRGIGWGHYAASIPTAVGEHLYVPIMSGTVFVIRWNAEQLNEEAIVSINDLGPAGKSWTRASLSYSDGKLYAHTIRELICIGQ
ncbi:MAG: hypothetical protein ACI9HK_000615 [Pirellulaceae bacterium]|jgi:hypothetical protein